MHPNTKFAIEEETDNKLSFLDITVPDLVAFFLRLFFVRRHLLDLALTFTVSPHSNINLLLLKL